MQALGMSLLQSADTGEACKVLPHPQDLFYWTGGCLPPFAEVGAGAPWLILMSPMTSEPAKMEHHGSAVSLGISVMSCSEEHWRMSHLSLLVEGRRLFQWARCVIPAKSRPGLESGPAEMLTD